jgi:hypothetical protein
MRAPAPGHTVVMQRASFFRDEVLCRGLQFSVE